MFLIKWLLFVFLQLETEKYFSLAKTYIISKPSELYPLAENLTFPNTIINSNSKSNNETRAGELQISDMITSQQTNNGFSSDLQPLKCNNSSNIKIHCCKKSNSLIECKYDDYKYKIKLNNNMLTQDQIGGLVRSIYTFIDSLTSNNRDLPTAGPISSTIRAAYPILNNTDRLHQLKTYFDDELKKLNSTAINSQIADEYEILKSEDNTKDIKFKKVKDSDPNQQNKIIECSLNNKINLNKGTHIRALRNLNEEPELRLSCKLIGSQSSEPKMFTIPLSLTDSESRTNQINENKIYKNLLKDSNLTEEQYIILNGHHLEKRNCKSKYKHSVKTVHKKEHSHSNYTNRNKDEEVRTHCTDGDNQDEYSSNKNVSQNKNSKLKSKNKELISLQEGINTAPEKSDSLRNKLDSVKAWVLNLKEKKIKSKGETNDEPDNEKQSLFLFNPKLNDTSDQGNIFKTDKPKKGNGKKNKDSKILDKSKFNANKINSTNAITCNSSRILQDLYDDETTTKKSKKKHNKTEEKDEDYEKSPKTPNKTKHINEDTDKSINYDKENEEESEKTTESRVITNDTLNFSGTSTAKSRTKYNKSPKTHKKLKQSEISNDEPTTSNEELEDSDNNITENTGRNFEIDNLMNQSFRTTTESYFYKKLKNMKDKKNNLVKSFTHHSNKTKNENINDNDMDEETVKSYEPHYTTGSVLKEFFIFKKHDYHLQNETNNIKPIPSTLISKANKILEQEKLVSKGNDEDHTYSTEHLTDENETDEEQADNNSNKSEYEDYNGESIKQKINPLGFHNGQVLNSMKFNPHKRRLETFREEENRRKRLFDFISLLKQSKKN